MQPQTLPDQYRVTFDVMAGIEPMTFPAATTTDQVAYQVQRAFIAVDDMHPDNAQVAIDVEAGTVVVSVDGDVIEHGSITRVDQQPDLRPVAPIIAALWLRNALVQMTMRYGTSTQKMAYAEFSTEGIEVFKRHQRARRRQFAAIQRLARALAELAEGGTR